MSKIVLDTREHALGEALSKIDCPFEWKQLDVGDIEFHGPEESALLTIERKTIADLESSITDGRYAEQRHRLVDNRPSVAYVIEGSAAFSSHSPRVAGAMLSLGLSHKIPVLQTRDVEDTAVLVRSLCAFLSRPAKESQGYAGAACRASCVKKRDNVDPHQCYLHQLSQIPGLSYGLAVRVASHPGFGTMRSMISTLEALGGTKERKAALSAVEKVGPKLAERLLSYVYGTEEDTSLNLESNE